MIRKPNVAYVELTKENFEDTITGSDMVVVDFWAVWCGPCKLVAPEMEKIAEKYDGVVDVVKVDVDGNVVDVVEHPCMGEFV